MAYIPNETKQTKISIVDTKKRRNKKSERAPNHKDRHNTLPVLQKVQSFQAQFLRGGAILLDRSEENQEKDRLDSDQP